MFMICTAMGLRAELRKVRIKTAGPEQDEGLDYD
jgi:hypothetical protein